MPLILFFSLTLLSSSGIVALAALTGSRDSAVLATFVPSLIAVIITAFISGKAGLNDLLFKQIFKSMGIGWLGIALLLFPVLALLAASLTIILRGGRLELYDPALDSLLAGSILIPLGEEFGWRGFALPRLQKRFTALIASLILGLLWGLWHVPAFLIGTGVPLQTPFIIFLLWVLAATILMTWVYNHTQSVLATIIMHASANATFNILPLLPEHTGQFITFLLFIGLSWWLVLLLLRLKALKKPAT